MDVWAREAGYRDMTGSLDEKDDAEFVAGKAQMR
jgi:hypothetical protein